MISAFREQVSVKKGGVVEVRCPDLHPDTAVDVIILMTSPQHDKKTENHKVVKYPASDFLLLLKDGPKISLKQERITREWIHRKENENDLYR